LPGSITGWEREIPLSNPPGTNYCDWLMDASTVVPSKHKMKQLIETIGLTRFVSERQCDTCHVVSGLV
jgi:hypothetical protein